MAGKAPLAVFRADASVRIGGGHVVRCLALAEELVSRGWVVAFCATTETFEVAPDLAVFSSNGTIDQRDAGAARGVWDHWPGGASLLVVDHYKLDAPFEAALRDFARVILVVDDFPTRRHSADILVDTTLGRRASEYDGVVSGRALCGADYAMLRQPFRRARALAQTSKHADNSNQRALISLGLTDPDDATSFILESIKGIIDNVDIVLGERAPHRDRIAALAERTSGWRFHSQLSAGDMADLLSKVDFVVGAAGSAAYERCCLGKASFLLQTVTNQSGNIAALVKAGVARSLGIFGDVSARSVHEVIAATIKDRGALAHMGETAANLVDGNGVIRVVDAVEAALAVA